MLISLISCFKEKYEGTISYNQEIQLGNKIDSIIFNKLLILDTSSANKTIFAYKFIDSISNNINSSSHITLTKNKKYFYRIIIDTSVNIFNLPGNYIYITTGLLKKLNNTAQLACGLSHFISHNDRRHQVTNLEKFYGINNLLKALFGDNILLNDISNKILTNFEYLAYSESQEKEALNYAIYYLQDLNYYDIIEMTNFEKYLSMSESLKKLHCNNINKTDFIINILNQLGNSPLNKDKLKYDIFKTYLP